MGSGQPKASKPPAVAPRSLPPEEIGAQAMKAGEEEGRRLRRRRGRWATRLASPDLAMVPATVSRAGLKTKLGGGG